MFARYVPSILVVLAVGWMPAAIAQERRIDPGSQGGDIAELARIRSFGFIRAHVESTDGASSNEVELNGPEMTKYLRERFENHFAKVSFAERLPASVPELEESTVGRLWCRIWTVGTSYPIAYFVECRLGSFRAPVILEQSALGYDNRENIAETIRKSIDNTVAGLAKTFLQNRGGKPRQYVPSTR